jgi:hypothetical protein
VATPAIASFLLSRILRFMEQAVIIGNCQARALEEVLKASRPFSKRYTFARFPAVHEIPETMIEELHKVVSTASVVVLQRVDDGYRDGIGLGTDTLAALAVNANVIRWPNLYWGGYFPDLCYLRNAAGAPVHGGPSDYHDRVILDAFLAGVSVQETWRYITDPNRPSEAATWAQKATEALQRYEADCDIHVTPYIKANHRRELLFFTMNHPSDRMLCFLAEQITERLGIDELRYRRPLRRRHDLLGRTFYPLHANHSRALGLQLERRVAGNCPYIFRGAKMDPIKAVQWFFNYYGVNRELVELNAGGNLAGF